MPIMFIFTLKSSMLLNRNVKTVFGFFKIFMFYVTLFNFRAMYETSFIPTELYLIIYFLQVYISIQRPHNLLRKNIQYSPNNPNVRLIRSDF